MLKKVNALILALAILLAAGCSKKNEPTPAPVHKTGASKCVVTEVKRFDYSYPYTVANEYDAQQKLSKSITNYRGAKWYETTYVYNSQGKLVSTESKDDNLLVWFTTQLEYNAAGQLEKQTLQKRAKPWEPLMPTDWSTYEYDANNRLVKCNAYQSNYPSGPYYIEVISYPAENKIVREKQTNYRTTNYTKEVIFEHLLDGNKKALLGAERAETYGGFIGSLELMTSQNILSTVVTHYYPAPETSNSAITYNYNAQGYPLNITQAINGGTPRKILELAYNCQ